MVASPPTKHLISLLTKEGAELQDEDKTRTSPSAIDMASTCMETRSYQEDGPILIGDQYEEMGTVYEVEKIIVHGSYLSYVCRVVAGHRKKPGASKEEQPIACHDNVDDLLKKINEFMS